MKKNKAFHIAAVSLIEIMMIFTIIGIVTGACVSLTKPKNEYMTKIKLYSAFMALDTAAKNIASEGHIDFTTDPHTCTQQRPSNKICPDYTTNIYPGIGKTLPKVAYRSTENNVDVDPGLTSHTPYSSLSATKQAKFKYLQSGLCQRLSRTFNVPESGIICTTTFSTAPYPASFLNLTPQLYLPNGQVIYIYNKLLHDYRTINGTLHKMEINSSQTLNHEYALLSPDKTCGTFQTIFPSLTTATTDLTYPSFVLDVPNETRNQAFSQYSANCDPTKDATFKYWKNIWSQNKDYFLIYIDINGKMSGSSDKRHGPDTLNKDVFAFKMYRDGSILPDYYSGFPINALTAKMLVMDRNGSGNYVYQNNQYSIKPLVYSRCYANLTGTYSSGYSYDHTGICSYGNSTKAPLNETTDPQNSGGCIKDSDETSACKSVILKPSFFIR